MAAPLPLNYERSDIFAVQNIALRPGLYIMVSSGVFQKPQEHATEALAPLFELSYNRNKDDIHSEVNKRPVEFKPGYASLGFINRASAYSEYHAGFDLKIYSLWVRPSVFNSFCHAVSGASSGTFSSFQNGDYYSLRYRTDAREEYLLNQLDSALEGGADRLNGLLVESRVLELLSLNIERLLGIEYPGAASVKLSRTDRENLLLAREIVINRLESPPSLVELSRLVHLNDCKLKRAFKMYFGKTIYEYIRDQRLEKAFSLLAGGHYNIGQSAFAVGYTNVSHFSQAFREKFGIGPKEVPRGPAPKPGRFQKGPAGPGSI